MDLTINNDEKHFFELRKEGKIYISKVFKYSENSEEMRNVKIVFENSNTVSLGEIDGAISLRQSESGKNQVVAIVTQNDKHVRSLSFEKFREVKPGYNGSLKDSFSFREDEWTRLQAFLNTIRFIDFSNRDNHQIEDLSSNTGNKTLIDSSEKALFKIFDKLNRNERLGLLDKIKDNLTKEDIQTILGRKEALVEFKSRLDLKDWSEKEWQEFFEKQQWIFGIGLDYRIMKQFDREMNVTATGTDNREKSIVDFLMTFTDFTVTVEIKKPTTPIFENHKNGRSGTWSFHSEFITAYSQVLEQKAEWHILGQANNLFNKHGSEKLNQRTRDAKAILVIGRQSEFQSLNIRENEIKQDTFELFRRNSRNVEILTYDELYNRACFIVSNEKF